MCWIQSIKRVMIKGMLAFICVNASLQYAASRPREVVQPKLTSRINVVFVYGTGSSPKTFDTIRHRFPPEYFNLYFFDPTVPTLTAKERQRLSLSYWSDELASFLLGCGLDDVHFIVHSFGARVVARFVEEKGDARVKSLVVEDMDFEARAEASHDPLFPLNYSAAVEDQKHIVSTFSFPTLILGAEKKSGVTDAGDRFFRTLCLDKKNINFINISGSSHSIHKSSPRSFMIEILDFYFRFGFFSLQQLKEASLRSVNTIIDDDSLEFLSFDHLSEWFVALSCHVHISTITNLRDLTKQLQSIWKSSLSKENKLRCTAFYEQRSQFILSRIYSHEKAQFPKGTWELTQLEWALLTKGIIPIPAVTYFEDGEPSRKIMFFGQQVRLDAVVNRASEHHLGYLAVSLKQSGFKDKLMMRVCRSDDPVDEKKTVLLLKIGE